MILIKLLLFREIVIAQSVFLPEETSNLLENRTKTLPLHPNIVRMVAAFADRVPSFSDSMDLYPAALPKRYENKCLKKGDLGVFR